MIQDIPKEKIEIHAQIFERIRDLFQIQDMHGAKLLSTMGRVMHLWAMLGMQRYEHQELSMPRWRVMMHLFMDEQAGKTCGLTPTELSQFNQVSKNTISALLRGLEEQGYIQRELDPKDLRIFRIHLTETGRELMRTMAPKRIEGLNEMLNGLDTEEIEELTRLLNKLRISLETQLGEASKPIGDECENGKF